MTFHIDDLDKLREHVVDERDHCSEYLIDMMEEFNSFNRGRYKGQIEAYDEILSIIRNIMKHGNVEFGEEDLND